MKDSRLYGKFTLDFPDSHKILPLSDAAFRCLVEATLWSRRHMTDGVLARRYAVARWSLSVLQELASNDPANPSLIEVEEGWLIHDFAEHQDTRAEIEARSARNKAAGQKGGQARAKRLAKRGASSSLSEAQAETETETTTTTHASSYVARDAGRANQAPPPFGSADAAERAEDHRHAAIARRQRDREARALAERSEIDACSMCDERGYRSGRVCDHDPEADARNAAGIAKVRAALGVPS